MKRWKMVVSVAAFAATVGVAPAAHAEFWEDAGWGSLTVLGNLGYMPAKVLYSGLGGLTGGLALGLTGGDMDVANKVWVPSMAGTYVLTPEMMRGEKEIAFVGETAPTSAARNDFQPPPYRALPPREDRGIAEEPLGGS